MYANCLSFTYIYIRYYLSLYIHKQGVARILPYADVCWRMLTYADVCLYTYIHREHLYTLTYVPATQNNALKQRIVVHYSK
jgi:hypothetical protein